MMIVIIMMVVVSLGEYKTGIAIGMSYTKCSVRRMVVRMVVARWTRAGSIWWW